jgi:hypothetical protein
MSVSVQHRGFVRSIDREPSLHYLTVAYGHEDWIALLAKCYATGATLQRVAPVSWFLRPNVQAWLRALNAHHFDLYVSINVIAPGRRSRRRQAIADVRHAFLDIDQSADSFLSSLERRRDLPMPSYIVRSSPGRCHVLWRVKGFNPTQIEALQRHLARELHTDPAATSCTQMTRLPGFQNHKRPTPTPVSIEYLDEQSRYTPDDFPKPARVVQFVARADATTRDSGQEPDAKQRARRYLAAVRPAIVGKRGDQHTFKVCCRVVRGFALGNADALEVLMEWNQHCQPPWTRKELERKIVHALLYGREPIGGLLTNHP